jgi:hypothetical protein
MSEEQQDLERYVLEIFQTQVVVSDDLSGERWAFSGPDRLLNATEKLNQLKAEEITAGTFITPEVAAKWLRQEEPSAFLADLTGYARRQRLSAMLKEVQEIETQAAALLADDARRLADATALRRRLEKVLERTVSPLSEPLSDQKSVEQDQGTADSEALEKVQEPFTIPADDVAHLYGPVSRRFLSRPQPLTEFEKRYTEELYY